MGREGGGRREGGLKGGFNPFRNNSERPCLPSSQRDLHVAGRLL